MDTPIDISVYLPHRAPMLMVDIIERMDDLKVETVFEIKTDNIFLEDGFFSETGLIENAAQTCSSVVAKDYFIDENNRDKPNVHIVGFISALKTLTIYDLPRTGSQLRTTATLVSKFITEDYTLCTMHCTTQHNQMLLLEGEINLFISEKPVMQS